MSKPLWVGIGGGSCSGKSTFANQLAASLQPVSVELVSTDRYFLHERGPQIRLSTGETLANMNHPDSANLALALEAATHATTSVVIFEGLMVLQSELLRPHLHIRLFVESHPSVCAVRRMIRATERSPDRTAEWSAMYYLECALPGYEAHVLPSKRYADLVIQGDRDTHAATALLADAIRARLAHSP